MGEGAGGVVNGAGLIHLEDDPVHGAQEERQMKGMMTFNLNDHRPRWKSPTPRPDFAVIRRGMLCVLLDAKYRDL